MTPGKKKIVITDDCNCGLMLKVNNAIRKNAVIRNKYKKKKQRYRSKVGHIPHEVVILVRLQLSLLLCKINCTGS